MDSEEKIMQALKDLEGSVGADNREEGLGQILGDMLGHQARSMLMVMWGATLLWLGVAVFAATRFFNTEDLKESVLYATLFLFSMSAVIGIKIWYWLRWVRNSMLREIKRLELRILVSRSERTE